MNKHANMSHFRNVPKQKHISLAAMQKKKQKSYPAERSRWKKYQATKKCHAMQIY